MCSVLISSKARIFNLARLEIKDDVVLGLHSKTLFLLSLSLSVSLSSVIAVCHRARIDAVHLGSLFPQFRPPHQALVSTSLTLSLFYLLCTFAHCGTSSAAASRSRFLTPCLGVGLTTVTNKGHRSQRDPSTSPISSATHDVARVSQSSSLCLGVPPFLCLSLSLLAKPATATSGGYRATSPATQHHSIRAVPSPSPVEHRFKSGEMRVKRQKCHRKSVRFYTSCFGFRQPFKVLCDGTFVHHLIANTIKPADTAISNILSAAPVKLFTTRCVLAELKRLGTSYFQALEAAHQLFTVSCDHEKNKSADACIKDVIGQNNPEHFFVATQDTDLRKKFQEIPGVPIIFGLRNSLFLEPPSAFQRQFVKTSEEARLHMTELDRKMLQKRSRYRSVDKEANNSSGENEDFVDQKIGIQDERKPPTARKAMSVKDRVQFKRKKAKGPNPLSCRKKSHEKPKLVLEKEKKDSENSARSRSRSRKRKRSRGGKKIAEKDG